MLGCLSLALALGVAALRHQEGQPENVREGAHAARDPIAPVTSRLTHLVADAPASTLADAWLVLRALGPRADESAREKVAVAAQKDALDERLPRWAGQDPRLALAATLLETGAAPRAADSGFESLLAAARRTSADPFTQAWRLEYLALSLRARRKGVRPAHVAEILYASLKLLERGPKPGSLEYAWLASAAFKAAPLAADARQAPQLRRSFARLGSTPLPADPDPELLAATLEARASYALWQRSVSGALPPSIRQGLERERRELAAGAEGRGLGVASAALRALRLSWAVLRDTNSVFTQ
jgi:hypothetical protein